MAAEVGFDGKECRAISAVASGLANEVLARGGSAELAIGRIENEGLRGIQIVVRTRAAGIAGLISALPDILRTPEGVTSTSRNRDRLMDEFEVYQETGDEPHVIIRKWKDLEKSA